MSGPRVWAGRFASQEQQGEAEAPAGAVNPGQMIGEVPPREDDRELIVSPRQSPGERLVDAVGEALDPKKDDERCSSRWREV